ncbi:hypothetical protein ALT_1023 [Aspergillus lentulus]|uniref:Uncharacterized protein n=1 Tax=Aspergillus lentulus TaxID=293939 RepID=A0AAN4PBX3_ASPLE|nr:hypothetical protein ALT_1023 [Aspergillus lentulus]
MTRPVRHWPGGIPCSIKPHPEDDLSLDQMKEEVKGWLLFVRENWVRRSEADIAEDDRDYELRQRRKLVEQWASATQEFRNSFHDRAPIGLPGTESHSEVLGGLRYPAEALERINDTQQLCDLRGVISLVPVDPTNPINRARWMKFVILLYGYGMEITHCLQTRYMPSEAVPNPVTVRGNGNLSVQDFLSWLYLETALFSSIYLTRTGTILYLGDTGPFALVDEEGLRTGRLSLTSFMANGDVEDSILIRPFNMHKPYLQYGTLGKGLDDVKGTEGAFTPQNKPLNMDLPILDILCNAQAADELVGEMALGDRDQWEEDVERYAPGFLALEAIGRVAEYDLSLLTPGGDLGGGVKRRMLGKMASGVHPRFRVLPGLRFKDI